MSEEEFKNLKNGDMVTVKTYEELKRDSLYQDEDNDLYFEDNDIFFAEEMKYLCGTDICVQDKTIDYFIADDWSITRYMIKPSLSSTVKIQESDWEKLLS